MTWIMRPIADEEPTLGEDSPVVFAAHRDDVVVGNAYPGPLFARESFVVVVIDKPFVCHADGAGV